MLVHNFKTFGTLRVVVSIDDGQSWESVHLIEDGSGGRQGLTIVHLSYRPEPYLTLTPPSVSHRNCLR